MRLVSCVIEPEKIRIVEYFIFERGSKLTRNTRAASGSEVSGFNWFSASFVLSLAGSACTGEGVNLQMISNSSVIPTSCRASVKSIGMRVPLFRAVIKTMC